MLGHVIGGGRTPPTRRTLITRLTAFGHLALTTLHDHLYVVRLQKFWCSEVVKSITDEGMTFLQKAISIQPSERFTALIALDDPWLKDTEQVSCQASKPQEGALYSSGAPLDHTTDKAKAVPEHRPFSKRATTKLLTKSRNLRKTAPPGVLRTPCLRSMTKRAK
jgi:hypothetical protein